jgi:hypothetical protein
MLLFNYLFVIIYKVRMSNEDNKHKDTNNIHNQVTNAP